MTDESATLYDLWKDPHDVPMYLTYHVYNLTNADDVQFRGAKPNITMLGPITYTEKRKKFNITWNEDRTMVSYFYRRYFNFVSTPCDEITDHETACSALSDETEIVTANIPIASLIIQIQNLNLPEWLDDIVKPLISQVLERLQKEFPGQGLEGGGGGGLTRVVLIRALSLFRLSLPPLIRGHHPTLSNQCNVRREIVFEAQDSRPYLWLRRHSGADH